MKIVSVVGARPQFIKAAVVSRELTKCHNEVLVHTGQHFDYNMSEVFFEELEIPKPKYNLGISGGNHGQMTGRMIEQLENVLLKENPDAVILYGDTNSTLAGAIATVKLHIPIIHVEAGSRVGTLDNPEEVNTIVTDNLASLLFCCTQPDVDQLKKEGITENVYWVGDPMFDAFKYYSEKAQHCNEAIDTIGNEKVKLPEKYVYMTCHRPENTEKPEKIEGILDAANSMPWKCVYPVHPRNRIQIEKLLEKRDYGNVIFCNPVSYLMSVHLIQHAQLVVTDSGGLQREAFFGEKQCLTVFDRVMWKETMVDNRNQLVKPNKEDILAKMQNSMKIDETYTPFGTGNSAEKIVAIFNKYFGV